MPAELLRKASRSHGIGLRPTSKELWMCDVYHDRTYVFDLTVSPPKQVATIVMQGGGYWMDFSPDGKRCYISERVGNTVAVIDTASRQTVARIAVGTCRSGCWWSRCRRGSRLPGDKNGRCAGGENETISRQFRVVPRTRATPGWPAPGRTWGRIPTRAVPSRTRRNGPRRCSVRSGHGHDRAAALVLESPGLMLSM